VAEKTAKEAVEKEDIGKTVQKEIDGITKEKVRQEIQEATREEVHEQFRKILGEYPPGRKLRPWVATVFKVLGTEKEEDRPPPKPLAGKSGRCSCDRVWNRPCNECLRKVLFAQADAMKASPSCVPGMGI